MFHYNYKRCGRRQLKSGGRIGRALTFNIYCTSKVSCDFVCRFEPHRYPATAYHQCVLLTVIIPLILRVPWIIMIDEGVKSQCVKFACFMFCACFLLFVLFYVLLCILWIAPLPKCVKRVHCIYATAYCRTIPLIPLYFNKRKLSMQISITAMCWSVLQTYSIYVHLTVTWDDFPSLIFQITISTI